MVVGFLAAAYARTTPAFIAYMSGVVVIAFSFLFGAWERLGRESRHEKQELRDYNQAPKDLRF